MYGKFLLYKTNKYFGQTNWKFKKTNFNTFNKIYKVLEIEVISYTYKL